MTIKISKTINGLLAASLLDVLSCIYNGEVLFWKILWIYATGKPIRMTMLEYENEINNAQNGRQISWQELQSLAKNMSQCMEILLIGDENLAKLKKYNTDYEMIKACKFTILLDDSTFWIINTNEPNTIKLLKTKLKGEVENDTFWNIKDDAKENGLETN
jgi:hypothetical protein